ncbi:MAG: rhomboid family intramembrane serine protease [bacterium]|nr:rhomboid family intramembrane serine protease [bacterium]
MTSPKEETSHPSQSFLSQRPRLKDFLPALLYAALATCITLWSWQSPVAEGYLQASLQKTFGEQEYYRLFTGLFVHSNPSHLLNNMLFLIPFGGLLTAYFGWRLFPFLSILLGIMTHGLTLYSNRMGGHIGPPLQDFVLNGSSGMLYAMFGLWLVLYFRSEIHLSAGKRWLRILGFVLIMMVPSQLSPQVSYRAHAIGFFLGLIAGIIFSSSRWKAGASAAPPPL